MRLYRKNEWKIFRNLVFELDDFKCTECNRGIEDNIVLQVHHLNYEEGRLPWEYPTEDCITLCKGCHAREHGLIKPKHGWQYMGDDDLGGLIGICENCGTSIRYNFIIFHEDWGTLQVGTLCCDNLTDSELATNNKESRFKYNSRLKRFTKSKKWVEDEKLSKIKISGYDINISLLSNKYFVEVNGLKSKMPYNNLQEAKIKLFDIIQNGELEEFYRSNFLFRTKKGHLIKCKKTNYTILYLKKKDDSRFVGCIFSETVPEEYHSRYIFSHKTENEKDMFLTDFYYIQSQIIDIQNWRPFKIVGKLNKKMTKSISRIIKDQNPIFYENHLKVKRNSA